MFSPDAYSLKDAPVEAILAAVRTVLAQNTAQCEEAARALLKTLVAVAPVRRALAEALEAELEATSLDGVPVESPDLAALQRECAELERRILALQPNVPGAEARGAAMRAARKRHRELVAELAAETQARDNARCRLEELRAQERTR